MSSTNPTQRTLRAPDRRARASYSRRWLPSPAITNATSGNFDAKREATAMKSCGRFCGTRRPANPITRRAPAGRSGDFAAVGSNRAGSTPLCTTSAGARTRGAMSRRTASPLQMSRSGRRRRAHADRARPCSQDISVLPARHTIGTPQRRAAGVPTSQENEPDANTRSMSRSRISAVSSAMHARQHRGYRQPSASRATPRGADQPPGKLRVNTKSRTPRSSSQSQIARPGPTYGSASMPNPGSSGTRVAAWRSAPPNRGAGCRYSTRVRLLLGMRAPMTGAT
jgi:hypothetical protein